MSARNKHSSLLQTFVNLALGPNVIRLFTAAIKNVCNKLVCFSLVGLYNIA
jgi:hypothetical protein